MGKSHPKRKQNAPKLPQVKQTPSPLEMHKMREDMLEYLQTELLSVDAEAKILGIRKIKESLEKHDLPAQTIARTLSLLRGVAPVVQKQQLDISSTVRPESVAPREMTQDDIEAVARFLEQEIPKELLH